MKRPRAGSASLILSLLPVLSPLVVPSAVLAADRPAFSGSIRDALGHVVQGVEVLVVARTSTPQPVASAQSDGAGKFAFMELAPGAYRVAAVKDGYLTSVRAINTTLQDWIDIVLRPVPAFDSAESATLPRDPSWALRLPRRHILREIDDAPRGDRPIGSTAEPPEDAGLGMHVEQTFAVGSGVEGQNEDDPALSGSTTQVRLDTAMGRRGSIYVQGSHQSLDSSGTFESSDLTASREANSLHAAISYETKTQDRLSASAFYRDRALEWSTRLPEEETSRGQQEQRYWGYDSQWTKRLDPRSSVTVALEYRDVRLGRPGVETDEPAADGRPALSGRLATTAGSYQTRVAPAHQVDVALRADLFDALSPGSSATSVGGRGGQSPWGLSLALDARDTWELTGPVSLVYGLSYRQAMDGESASAIVPRVGAAWRVERFAWHFSLSHHTTLHGAQPARRLGYDTRVELPISDRIRVIGVSTFTPARFEVIGHHGLATVDIVQPIYLSDGRADVREDRIAVINDLGTTRSFVEWNRGNAEGNLAPVPIQDTRMTDRSAGAIEYAGGRAGVHIVPSGTDVVVQYTRVTDHPATLDTGNSESRQQVVELRLAQDLAQLGNLGNWRFLMGARVESLDNSDDEGVSDTALDSMSRQVSAGLSVEF